VHALAGALDLHLIAEGVETPQQHGILRALGVPMAQGWLWGAAVAPEEFRERFGTSSAATVAESNAGSGV
jgi:sensor c-di-GMP phosphodiesterase-like protein